MAHSWNSTSFEALVPEATFIVPTTSSASPDWLLRPVMESHTMLPPPSTQKETLKYTAKDWDERKPEIMRQYKDNTLENVRAFMRQNHGFDATAKQYKDRIKKWKLDKNIKPAEMQAILRKEQERVASGKPFSAFRVRKQPVHHAKISRYKKEHSEQISISANDAWMDPDPRIDAATTPDGISVYTPSDTGPYTPLATQSTPKSPNIYAASPQNSSLYQYDDTVHMITNSAPVLNSIALASTPIIGHPNRPDVLLGRLASISQSPQPTSPALSISSIIRPLTSNFTGQSPACTHRTLSTLPRGSTEIPDTFPNQSGLSPSNFTRSTPQMQIPQLLADSTHSRYKQRDEESIRQELSLMRILFGESNPDTLLLSSKLANLLLIQGRYKSAEEIIRRALAPNSTNNNVKDFLNLQLLALLGQILHHQGFYIEAETINRKTLQSQKAVLGFEHPDTLKSISCLALTLWSQGRWKEAEDLQVQVLDISRRVLGHEHPDTLESIGNLASKFWSQGRWKEAEDLEVQVLDTSRRVLGQEHPDTLTRIRNLAATFQCQGRWKEAEGLEAQVLDMSRRVLGHEHPDTLTSIGNLAAMFRSQGRWKEAEELQVQVLDTRSRVLGQEHPNTLHSISGLAETFQGQGRWKEAEDLGLQVTKTKSRVLGPEHPSTLRSKNDLAATFRNQGRWMEAEELGLQVTEMRSRLLGPEHPDTLRSINDYALTLKLQDRSDEALGLMAQCVDARKRKLGIEHPDTVLSLKTLSQWQM